MKNSVAIIDYGVGNIRSVYNAFRYCDPSIEIDIVSNPECLSKYSKIILPGVGAFQDAMKKIIAAGFDEAIIREATNGKHILGICLGMQLLGTCSFEFGKFNGLNIIEGEVHSFEFVGMDLKNPHVGWNSVHYNLEDVLFKEVQNDSDFYFLHSYYFVPKNSNYALCCTDYGINFASVIKKDNVYGVQFHPEKSQKAGLHLLKNFLLL